VSLPKKSPLGWSVTFSMIAPPANGLFIKDGSRMAAPDKETIYDSYFRLLAEWKEDRDLDKCHDHLPILVAADHLANQMKTETDRIIQALASRSKG
jgi:hypothetical protein